jgi:putative SOS response-associated peptidase YedK
MCGRYSETRPFDHVRERIPFDVAELSFTPRFNIAPTQSAPVVVQRDQRALSAMRWGLIPFWAKDESIANKLFNARAETIREKPAFRAAFKSRRCLVPADGFYEWRKLPGCTLKQPYRFLLKSREPFAFAGLWECWRNAEGEPVQSFTILTSEANDLVRATHHRMPVILPPEAYEPWLDPKYSDLEKLAALLKPFPAETMSEYAVGRHVNNSRVDSQACAEPLPPPEAPPPNFRETFSFM